MNKVTSGRLKELASWGYMNNSAKVAQELTYIINNAYSEWQNDDTYFLDKKETEIQVTPQSENQQNVLNGMSVNFPDLVSVSFTHDLNDAHIKNIDTLVRLFYKKVVA